MMETADRPVQANGYDAAEPESPRLSLHQVAEKRRQLRTMENALMLNGHMFDGPRGGIAFLWGVGTFAFLSVTLHYILPSTIFSPTLVLGALAILTSLFAFRLSTAPRTWAERLLQLLCAYHPVDSQAFRRLQEQTMAQGFVNFDQVRRWVTVERKALKLHERSKDESNALTAFCSRKVGE